MRAAQLILLLGLAGCLFIGAGCESDSDSGGGSGGELAGTWRGNVGGRSLTMTLNQNGTSLSGNYTLQDPTFSEGVSGSAGSATAPTSATLNGGADRRFEVNFSTPFSMNGGYYKGSEKVASVSASK